MRSTYAIIDLCVWNYMGTNTIDLIPATPLMDYQLTPQGIRYGLISYLPLRQLSTTLSVSSLALAPLARSALVEVSKSPLRRSRL